MSLTLELDQLREPDRYSIEVTADGAGFELLVRPLGHTQLRRVSLTLQEHPIVETVVTSRSEFRHSIAVAGLPRVSELALRLEDDGPFRACGRIRVGRQRHATASALFPDRASLAPISVSGVMRSGTTWLTATLAAHENIVSGASYPFEDRSGAYWMHLFTTLTRGVPRPPDAQGFRLRRREASAPPAKPRVRWPPWFGGDHVARTWEYCHGGLQSELRASAHGADHPRALFFVEKSDPNQPLRSLLHEPFERGADILLVRDPRDVMCSIFAFNEKRQSYDFDVRPGESPASYATKLAQAYAYVVTAMNGGEHETVVRYEDMVRDPGEVVRGLLEQLGLGGSRGLPRLVRKGSRDARPRLHATTPSAAASVGRWRNAPEELRDGVGLLHGLAAELGYDR